MVFAVCTEACLLVFRLLQPHANSTVQATLAKLPKFSETQFSDNIILISWIIVGFKSKVRESISIVSTM